MSGLPLTPLDKRKQVILKAVVTDYVYTAEPVGSESLAGRYEFGVKSATIRNEMAELAEMGYLHQPHTSAGRIPSDMGYRFYVDRLMEAAALSRSESARAKHELATHRTEADIIIEQTCRILSSLAHYTSLATHPAVKDSAISHISVTNVARGKMLVVVVLDNGSVLHELLEFGPKSRRIDAVEATNFLTRRLAGRTLESSIQVPADSLPPDAPYLRELLAKVIDFIKSTLDSAVRAEICMEGASYIVQQPEFKDVERLEALLSVLERRSVLYRLLSSVYLGPEVTVIIGSENPVQEMCDCSFVGAKYHIGGRAAGTIGLLGPTRMDYRRAVSAVEFMAGNLSGLLTQLSLG